jgi:hypothetical protein
VIPRHDPSRYDHPDRPWYILAKENPENIMVIDAYRFQPDMGAPVTTLQAKI